MRRKIISYDKDEEGDWRAELECGHYQHVRHKPPLINRKWVLTEEGRNSRLGFELECKKCVEKQPPDFQLKKISIISKASAKFLAMLPLYRL